jgi:hypothetical protein
MKNAKAALTVAANVARFVDKTDLWDFIIQCGAIDFVPDSTSRVSDCLSDFCLSDLRRLRPSDLRRLMNEAGVYWKGRYDSHLCPVMKSRAVVTETRTSKTSSPRCKTIVIVVLDRHWYTWKRWTRTTAIRNPMTDRGSIRPTVLGCIPNGSWKKISTTYHQQQNRPHQSPPKIVTHQQRQRPSTILPLQRPQRSDQHRRCRPIRCQTCATILPISL